MKWNENVTSFKYLGIVSMLSELLSFTYPHSHTCSPIFVYHYLTSNPYCFPCLLFQRDQAFSVNKSIENTTTDFFKQSAAYFIEWRSARTKIILKKYQRTLWSPAQCKLSNLKIPTWTHISSKSYFHNTQILISYKQIKIWRN